MDPSFSCLELWVGKRCVTFHYFIGIELLLCLFNRLTEAFSGAATTPFSPEITQVLMSPINEADVEIKPDGTVVADL